MRFRDLHINIKVRIVVLLFQSVTSNMILPFMAIYFAYHFGATLTGIIMLITVLGSIIASFYGGYYADLLGRRKILVRAEQFRFLAFVAMAAVNSPWLSLPVLTIVFLMINNICFGLSNPARESMIIDVSPPETRKFIYTITYWVNNFSLAIGTLLGAFFYQSHFFELLTFTALATLITCVIMQLFIIETKHPTNDDLTEAKKVSLVRMFSSYKDVFKDVVFLKYFIASLLILGLELQLANYISIRLANEFGTQQLFNIAGYSIAVNGVEMYGILRTENTILVIILAALVVKFTNKLSHRLSIYIGVILFTLGYMVVGVINNGWLLLFATLLFTIGELMYVPVKKVWLADIAKEELRSRYMAVNSLTFRGGLMLGSIGITMGAFIPSWGMAILFGLMGAVSLFLYSEVHKQFELKKYEDTTSQGM